MPTRCILLLVCLFACPDALAQRNSALLQVSATFVAACRVRSDAFQANPSAQPSVSAANVAAGLAPGPYGVDCGIALPYAIGMHLESSHSVALDRPGQAPATPGAPPEDTLRVSIDF